MSGVRSGGDKLARMKRDALDSIELARSPMAVEEARDVLALVEIAEAARPLFMLAAVAHEGDPWYAQHEGLDAEKILGDARAAFARLDGGAAEEQT